MMPYDNQKKRGEGSGLWVQLAWLVLIYAVAGLFYIALRLMA